MRWGFGGCARCRSLASITSVCVSADTNTKQVCSSDKRSLSWESRPMLKLPSLSTLSVSTVAATLRHGDCLLFPNPLVFHTGACVVVSSFLKQSAACVWRTVWWQSVGLWVRATATAKCLCSIWARISGRRCFFHMAADSEVCLLWSHMLLILVDDGGDNNH